MSTGTPAVGVVDRADLDAWLAERTGGYLRDVADLVRIESVTPHEAAAIDWAEDYFRTRGRVTREPPHPRLSEHPAANHNAHLGRPDRGTLRVAFGGTPRRGGLLFSAHVDVVPAGPGFPDAYAPRLVDGRLYGRGACDTKGNIVLVAAALDYLRERSVPHRPAALDLVVEEEIGGNGALSGLLHGRDVDGVVVLEPTGLEVFHGHRGCLEATAVVTGRAGHMGGTGVSAVLGAVDLIGLLRALERELVEQARADPAFHGFVRPVQVNVGTIHGGEWHGSLAERCVVGLSVGVRPGTTVDGARRALEALPGRLDDPWLREHVEFRFEGIHNGAFLGDPDSVLATALRAAVRAAGAVPAERRAWCVSCDARLYHDLLGVPVVVFGAGSLDQAHAGDEYLDVAEWARGVRAVVHLLAGGAGA